MKKVKITVIKCGLNQDLIDKYIQANIDPCSYNIEVGRNHLVFVIMLENQLLIKKL